MILSKIFLKNLIFFTIIFLLSILCVPTHSVNINAFVGHWPFVTFQNHPVDLYICSTTDGFQGRYTDNGHTLGFISSISVKENGDPNDITAYGEWYEAGGHLGTFEIRIKDVTNSEMEVYLWYEYQELPTNHNKRYLYYSQHFTKIRTSDNIPDSSTDCFVTNSEIDFEGHWSKGGSSDSDSFFICKYNNSLSGKYFEGYWHGELQRNGSIINGRWYSMEYEGALILKLVGNSLYGTFYKGITNKNSDAIYEFTSALPIMKLNEDPLEPYQCINTTLGFSGTWTESLYGQTMSLCTKPDGTLFGAYTKKVLVNNIEKVMPIAFISGKIENNVATGIYNESGQNEKGIFKWTLDNTTFTNFTGFFWSYQSLVPGINVLGMIWNEERVSYVASHRDCLAPNFNSSSSSIEGYWSMEDFENQIDPITGGNFVNMTLTICYNTSTEITSGIYRNKGDWKSNNLLFDSVALGYFKEYTGEDPNVTIYTEGVKIAGNVLFRMLHENFSIAYHFEGEDNKHSSIGHFRVHTRLDGDLSLRNCTPVFLSVASRSTIIHIGILLFISIIYLLLL